MWLVCLWLGVAVMGIWAAVLGDVQVLRTGRDMYGNVCGLGDLKDLPMTYFPDPLESMDIALCVAACPLESIPEYIRIYNPDLATFEADIWYDSYPSRPLYNSYCLPAQAHLRLPVQSKLFSRDYSYTFVLRDIIEGGNALVFAAMGTYTVMGLFLGLFHIIRCQKWVYAGSTFLLIAELGYLSYGLYIEPERQMADLCGDYNLVHMQDCSLPVEDYRELFKACIVVFWAVLVVVTQMSKSKNEGLEQFKELKLYTLWSVLAWSIILIMGYSVFIIITCCILGVSSIGTSTLQVSDFEYPIQTWEYDYTLRCALTVWCLVTGMWTLSWLSQAVLVVSGMDATQTAIGRIKQNWRNVVSQLVWASLTIPLYRLISTVPDSLYHYWTKALPSVPKAAASVLNTPFDFTFPDSGNHNVAFPRYRNVDEAQWKAAEKVEKLLWPMELSLILLGPTVLHIWLSGWDAAISSYLALELIILPYSYFLSQLFSNYLRGMTYSFFKSDANANGGQIDPPAPFEIGKPVVRVNAVVG